MLDEREEEGGGQPHEASTNIALIHPADVRDNARLGHGAKHLFDRRCVLIRIPQLGLDVDDIIGNVIGLRWIVSGLLEWLEWRLQGEPAAAGDAGCRTLAVDAVGAGVGVEDTQGLCGIAVGLLPLPEHVVDPAVVEVEDWVEGCGVLRVLVWGRGSKRNIAVHEH